MYSFIMDPKTGALSERKKYTIGTQQVRLTRFETEDQTFVFACSDHPTVIHSERGKLQFANVNVKVFTSSPSVSPFKRRCHMFLPSTLKSHLKRWLT